MMPPMRALVLSLSLVSFSFACGSGGAAGDVTSTTKAPPPQAPNERCVALDSLDAAAIRMVSQGGHADARVDARVELEAGRLVGQGYRLDGNDPVGIPVDRPVTPEQVSVLTSTLDATCHPVEVAGDDDVAGGHTVFQVVDATGNGTWVAMSGAGIETGTEYVKIPRATWDALTAAFPDPNAAPDPDGCVSLRDAKQLVLSASSVPGTTTLSLDLHSGALTGKQPAKKGDAWIEETVDEAVPADALTAVRDALASLCKAPRIAAEDQHYAPGGGSVLVVTDAAGTQHHVVHAGFANEIPKGASVLEVSREELEALRAVWPD